MTKLMVINMNLKLLITLLILLTTINGQQMKLNILPTPQKVVNVEQQEFRIDEATKILLSDLSNTRLIKCADHLKNSIDETLSLVIEIADDVDLKNTISLNLIEEFQLSDSIPTEFMNEAYKLEIDDDQININAVTEKGIYYGCISLIQLIENTDNEKLPGCKIIDWPDMKIRGISDDISRGQVSTLENFKRIISFISRYKMNTYMPYIEDMIQFKSYPSIGKNRGALTSDEIKEIVAYADEHFVEVIPIFQTLGHYENILSQKEFIEYADFPGAASLDVTNEKTYTFLETMLKEVFELFPSKYFHMGADESYDVGLGNSKKLVEETDLATVHANHYKRVYDICKKYNKEVMMYGDIILSHPEILEKIPKDITIVDWHYFPRFEYPSTALFDSAGFNYIVSPTVWNFNSAFPENFLAVPNIQTLTKSGIEKNSIGMINSCWGDYGAETFKELNLYGYAWSAQCAWNIEKSNVNEFNSSFFIDFYGTNDINIINIYNELSDPTNQLVWNAFWRHPLLDYRTPDWRVFNLPVPSKYFWMSKDFDDNEIATAKEKVKKNQGHMDLVEYVFKIKKYYTLKLETQQMFHEILLEKNVDKSNALHLINKNISSLIQLKKDFVKYWLAYNKKDNLWMVEYKFERMINYFNEIKEQLTDDSLISPLIKSKCIFYPSEADTVTESATFTKTFELNGSLESAYLQLIGDTYAKLYINNNFIDEVYVKRSGSLWVEQQRVKFIDVKNYLRDGENEIKVEAVNYRKNRKACINVIAQIATKEDTMDIMTDESWITKNNVSNEWVNAAANETETVDIIAPNFHTLRKSWIER